MPEPISRKEAMARGLKRYFTGKPCKWGHISERLAPTRACLGCRRAFDQITKRRAYKKLFDQTPKRLAHRKIFEHTPERLAYEKFRRQTSKYKAWRRRYYKLGSERDRMIENA